MSDEQPQRRETDPDRPSVYQIVIRIEDKLTDILEKHDERIGRLERWRAYISGGLALAYASVGVIAGLVVQGFRHSIR